MRPVSFGPLPPAASTDQKLTGSSARCARHENASAKAAIAVADSYGANPTDPTTRQLNVTSPAAANISAPSFQIVEVFRCKREGGRKHVILQVIDGSRAGDRQHDR
jgi:hypothetical protein